MMFPVLNRQDFPYPNNQILQQNPQQRFQNSLYIEWSLYKTLHTITLVPTLLIVVIVLFGIVIGII